MNVTQLIERFRRNIGYDQDPQDLTDAQVLEYLNEAQDEIAREILILRDNVNLSVIAGQADYQYETSFGERIVKVLAVYVDGVQLNARLGQSVLDPNTFASLFPYRLTTAAGSTQAAVDFGSFLRLFPTPTSIEAAKSYKVTAQIVPAAMVLMGGEISLPRRLHPHVAGIAAYKAAFPQATEGQQQTRLLALKNEADKIVDYIRRENTNRSVNFSWEDSLSSGIIHT
jgi:hypothetical protein